MLHNGECWFIVAIIANIHQVTSMTDDDIERIVEAVKADRHECVFTADEREDMRHSVEFYQRCNKILSDSGSTARNSFIRFLVFGTMVLVTWGCAVVMKMKQADLIP